MPKYNDKVEALLNRLDAAETDEEILAIGKALLNEDPGSPYGKLAVWETLDFEESLDSLDMLTEALESVRAIINSNETPTFIEDDRDSQVYCTIMMNLGYSLLSVSRIEEALEIARELANFDDEGYFPSRELLYRCMLDLEMYEAILETLEADPLESVVGEHARAIALIETGAAQDNIRETINYAISLAPDVVFFVLGMWPFPEEDEEIDAELEEVMMNATYLVEPWSKSDERLSALGMPSFMLGYLTERIEDAKEIEALLETYELAGILEEVKSAKAKTAQMIKNDEDPEEIDAVAMGEVGNLLELMYGETD